jgi:hypothetical protein
VKSIPMCIGHLKVVSALMGWCLLFQLDGGCVVSEFIYILLKLGTARRTAAFIQQTERINLICIDDDNRHNVG